MFIMSKQTRRLSFSLAAAVAVCVSAVHAQDVSTLTLPQRRAIKEYQDTKYTAEQKDIETAAGFSVPVEVKWGAIAKPGEAESYLQDDYWTNIFFVPLTKALKQVTADEMGAKALKDKLKKIVITYDKDTAPVSTYDKGVTFDGGTLTINFEPFSNSGDIDARVKSIADGLSAKL